MRNALIIAVTSLSLICVGTMVLPNVFAQDQGDADRQTQLDELLKQRRDTLARAVDLQIAYYRDGNCDFEEVITAQRNLHEAELDAAKTREQRVAILEKQLKSAQQSVAVAKTKFENGAGGETDMLQAKADLLHVKIRLVRQRP